MNLLYISDNNERFLIDVDDGSSFFDFILLFRETKLRLPKWKNNRKQYDT